MTRKIEDLDNRGCRHNLWVRGLPESFEPQDLETTVTAFFNNTLGRPPGARIAIECLHRELRPCPSNAAAPPVDVVCCLVDFRLKEDLLRRARDVGRLQHEGHGLQLYQDLSPLTLQQRRILKPLLGSLRSRGATYHWQFPFGLSATLNGQTTSLQFPEDLPYFCDRMDLPPLDLPEWNELLELPGPTA